FLFGYHGALRDLEPSRARDEAGRAVRVLLEALARRGPLVLVRAELHWADQLVLDLVDNLLDGLRSLPLLFVATARPELESGCPPRASGRRRACGRGSGPRPSSAAPAAPMPSPPCRRPRTAPRRPRSTPSSPTRSSPSTAPRGRSGRRLCAKWPTAR